MMRNLWHTCAKVREAIKLPFRVMSGISPDIGVLDEVDMPQGEGKVWGILVHSFE